MARLCLWRRLRRFRVVVQFAKCFTTEDTEVHEGKQLSAIAFRFVLILSRLAWKAAPPGSFPVSPKVEISVRSQKKIKFSILWNHELRQKIPPDL